MLKKKSIWIFLGLISVCTVIGIVAVTFGLSSTPTEFEKNGYIIVSNEQAEAVKYAFSAGTEYKRTFQEQYTFEDVQKDKVEVKQETFAHYDDGSVSAFHKGVLVDLNEVDNSNVIHHYALQEGMALTNTKQNYQIVNNAQTVELEEAVWKISDNKYIVLAQALDVVFSEDDVRSAGSFVEFDYIDEGVVQIVTGDNVWQTVSTEAKIRTAQGNEILLAEQYIQNEKGKMPLSKMVIDSDDNVELSPLETREQRVPKFDVDSENGTDGTSGENGTEGNKGTDGTQGTQGQNGENGEQGDDGEKGVIGEDGTTGEEGANGSQGNKGNSGKPGTNGSNASSSSSAKTAIPQFTLSEWEVDATSVKGKVDIVDDNFMLQEVAYVYIYNADNGEKYTVHSDSVTNPEVFENLIQGITFDTKDHLFDSEGKQVTLSPDTEYRLVVSAPYEMNEETFTREFISRVFYTDSLGVFMEKTELSTTSIRGKLTKNSYSNAGLVTLHLLTEEELAKFNETGEGGLTQEIKFEGEGTEEFLFDIEKFEKMKTNTIYYVRMTVKTQGSQPATYLSPQILKVATLKKAPEITGHPFASPNRKIGAFELYGGTVVDEDGAIITHRYEIYNDENKLVKTLDVQPSPLTNMTLLNVDGTQIKRDEEYYFKVVTIYNDNEKTVEVSSDFSSKFIMHGSAYPVLYFQKDETEKPDYFKGDLVIDLSSGAKIDVDGTHPLTLSIEAEGIFKKNIEYTSSKDSINISESEIRIPLNEIGLKDNTTYRINAHAYTSLDGGKTYEQVNLGYVVVRTRSLTTLEAKWQDTNAANTIQKGLKLAEKSVEHPEDFNLMSEIHVQLYNGNSTSVLLGEAVFTDTSKEGEKNTLVRDFVENEKIITEKDFPNVNPNTLTGQYYTLKVSAVYDKTKTSNSDETNSGNYTHYVNTFTVLEDTTTVTKQKVPPSLPDASDLSSQIEVLPITNEEAATYGGEFNDKLDLDTIVGFKLNPRYDNYASLARNITFHVFELNEYNELIKDGIDPNKEGATRQIFEKQIDIKASSVTVPTPVFLFGEGTDLDNINTYYTGNYPTDTLLTEFKDGMQRGYKYVFTYTVGYNPTGDGDATKLYPYDHPDYNEKKPSNGLFTLNSGTVDAPKTNPKFYIYPLIQNGTETTFHYAYTDVDHTIVQGQTEVNVNKKSKGKIEVGPNEWHDLNVSYGEQQDSVKDLNLTVNRALYNMQYNKEEDHEDDSLSIYQGEITDANTRTAIASVLNNDSKVKLEVNETLNKATVKVQLSSGNAQYCKSIVGIQLRFKTEEGGAKTKTVSLPLELSGISSLSGTFSTAALEDFVGKNDVTVTTQLIYDTGLQGWKYAKDSKNSSSSLFALQRLNNDGSYGNYIRLENGSSSSENASGSMFYTTEMFNIPEDDFEKETDLVDLNFSVKAYYDDLARNFKMKVTQNGISRYEATNPSAMELYTVKKLGTVEKELTDISGFPISKIIPSVKVNGKYANLNSIGLNNVIVRGTSQIKTEDDGNKYMTIKIKNETTGEITSKDVIVKENDEAFNITIPDLNKGTQYTLTFYALGKDGKEMALLDESQAEATQLSITMSTLGSVNITKTGAGYQRMSYYQHIVNLNYSTSSSTGYKIRYTLYHSDESGVVNTTEVYASHEDMLKQGIFDERDNYGGDIIETFRFDIDKETQLKPGHYYVMRVEAIDSSNEKDVLGSADIKFQSPVNTMPIPYLETTPLFEDGKHSLKFSFNLPDTEKVIMTQKIDGVEQKGKVYVRVFEQDTDSWNDVTKDENRKAYDIDQLHSLEYKDLKPNTVYRIALYASYDLDRNMKHDTNDNEKPLEVLEEEYKDKKDEFEKMLNDHYMIWEEECVTPGENGIAFGSMGIENPNGNQKYVSISFKNASNLNMIEQVEYDMLERGGTKYHGILENSSSNPLFHLKNEDTAGYYLLDLPDQLEKKGDYKVTLKFYVRNKEGKLEAIKTWSDRYLF